MVIKVSVGTELARLQRVMYQEQDKKRHASKRFNRMRKKYRSAERSLNEAWRAKQETSKAHAKKVDSRKKTCDLCRPQIEAVKNMRESLLEKIELLRKERLQAKSRRMKDNLEFLIRTHNEECDLYIPLYDEEIRRLEKEIKIAKRACSLTESDHAEAKGRYEEARQKFNQVKKRWLKVWSEYQVIQHNTNEAVKRFARYRDKLVLRAGVPKQYIGKVFVEISQLSHEITFYFGGKGGPKGEGCGYYVMNKKGKVIYRQRPVKLTGQG